MTKPQKTKKTNGTVKTSATAGGPPPAKELYEGQGKIRQETQKLKDQQALDQARIRGESTRYVADLLVVGETLVKSYAKRLRHTTKKNLPVLRKKLFLSFLGIGWSQADICRQFGFRTSLVADYKRNDEQFEAAVDARRESGLNIMEGVIWRAAVMGGFDSKFQDSTKRVLQALAPTKWREQKDLRVSSDMGILADTLPLDELIRQISIVKIDISGMLPAEDRIRLAPEGNRAFLPPPNDTTNRDKP